MCIIIDANVVSEVLIPPDKGPDEFDELRADIFSAEVPIVYGGQLASEYERLSRRVTPILVELRRGGGARIFGASHINALRDRLRKEKCCSSDDEHVIALARVTGARLLCSRDQALRDDFKSAPLVSDPRGKVWNERDHRALSRDACDACR